MKVAICTLGCKVNQYETQAMESELRRRGHQVVPFEETADAYVVNSCSVTAVSDRKSRQMLSRARKRSPEAIVALCGCYAQTHPEEAAALEVDLIAGTGDRLAFLDLLEQAAAERQPRLAIDSVFERRAFEILPAGGMEGRTRAMLKIEDGCVNFCSYCIIPYARGRVRSLSPVDAALEMYRLVEECYQEIVLTGIEISSWGQDLPGDQTLIDLLEALCEGLPPHIRVRLGSLEPRTITEDFCSRAAALPNLCPHFHLSLQSGCDATLKRMNRKYDSARYFQSVALLNRFFNRPAVTTDLIVGFPGETEAEFEETLAFLRRCGFAAMHIFPYSIRPGTPAAEMKPQVKKVDKEVRSRRAIALAEEMQRTYLAGCVGQVYPVLFEQEREGRFLGHAPNYTQVLATGQDLHNALRSVRVTAVEGDALLGEILEEGVCMQANAN